jgi:trimeric autotransporter adhesin
VRGSRRLGFGVLGVGLLLLAGLWVGAPGTGVPGPAASLRGVVHVEGPARAVPAAPVSLLAASSVAVGAQGRSFAVVSRSGVLVASGGGVSSSFTRAGVSLGTGEGAARLSLIAVGYGGRLAAVREVTPVADGSSVSYRRGSLREWYRNGPFGLEQGFTLARRPAGSQPGPLTLTLAIDGPLTARRSGSGIVLTSTDGRAVLSYGQLSVRDASGRSWPAAITPHGHQLVLRIWDQRARYPLTVDPFIGQAKLTAPTTGPLKKEKGDARFGVSVAVSSDGSTALIGGFEDHRGVGAAWVFIRTGTAWTLQRKLIAPTAGPKRSEKGEGLFGYSVALSDDGNTALIGAAYDDPAVCVSPCVIVPTGVGAAWVFIRRSGVWTEQRKLVAPTTGAGSTEIGDGLFGSSVALSSDGNTALIGAERDNGSVGAAWVFIRALTTWTLQAKLTRPTTGTLHGIPPAQFGASVALSLDGSTALIGGPGDAVAWVFIREGGVWTEQQVLTPRPHLIIVEPGEPSKPVNPKFGSSVALSSDGNTALLGGPFFNSYAGAARVFTRAGTVWTEQQTLSLPSIGPSAEIGAANFGWSVALSHDAKTALIGGDADNGGVGAAWAFTPGSILIPV